MKELRQLKKVQVVAYCFMAFLMLGNTLVATNIVNVIIDSIGTCVWAYLVYRELQRLRKTKNHILIEYTFTEHTDYPTVLKIRDSFLSSGLSFIKKIETRGVDTLAIYLYPDIEHEVSMRLGIMIGMLESQERTLKLLSKSSKYEVKPSDN